MVAEVLAIIPARGGSKGIPRKNIRSLAGYPLIAYSIAAAQAAKTVTRIILSTDDEEIAAVGREWGAETPFLRPAEFAQDTTLDLPVFQHALTWLAEHENYHPDIVVQLRPTSPLRPPALVDQSVQLLLDHPEADSVRGVIPSGQNPHKMWRIDPKTGTMSGLLEVPGIPEPYNAPRQALPQVYWQTGQIDAIRPRAILDMNSMSGKIILPVHVDARYAVDIDSLADWRRGESVIESGELEIVSPRPNQRRPLPAVPELLVLDFDGVMTDDRVTVDQDGREMVTASRSDGMGLALLRKQTALKVIVLSTETNPVVSARCAKLNLPVIQGVGDKAAVLKDYLQKENFSPENVIYLGNDVNDLPCFPLVGCAIAVADSQSAVLRQADRVLTHNGGHGAVRELCDLLIKHLTNR